jgi:hypothetical protein
MAFPLVLTLHKLEYFTKHKQFIRPYKALGGIKASKVCDPFASAKGNAVKLGHGVVSVGVSLSMN